MLTCLPVGALGAKTPAHLGATCWAPPGLPYHCPPCEGPQRTNQPTSECQSPMTSTLMLSSSPRQQLVQSFSTCMIYTKTKENRCEPIHTWSTLGCAPSRVLAGGSLLMKLPSSMGNWVKGCESPLGAGRGCARGPGPGPLCWTGPGTGAFVSSLGPFACGLGAGCSGPSPGPPCMGLACCVAAGLL